MEFRSPVTRRLLLAPAGLGDLAAMAPLHADERVWAHLPAGRHTDVEQTRRYLAACEQQWQRDELGYWVARLREQLGGLPEGSVAGIGGCAIPSGATWWNLYYRFVPEVQGQGLASEVCSIAIAAAQRVRPDYPVVASLLEHNRASKATAQRAGLTQVWSGPDIGDSDQEAVRLIYADRPLDDARLSALTHLT